MAIKVACFNLKGGVGKTTWAIILTQIALINGKHVVAFDQDDQLNFSYYISYLKDNASFKNFFTLRTDQLKEEYFNNITADFIIIDCPPSPNELTKITLKNADFILIPVIPNINSVEHLDKIRELAGEDKDLFQFPIVKIGFGAAGVGSIATQVSQKIIDMGYSSAVIGEVPFYNRMALHPASRLFFSVGLSAVQQQPFKAIYAKLLKRYEQLLQMRKNNND